MYLGLQIGSNTLHVQSGVQPGQLSLDDEDEGDLDEGDEAGAEEEPENAADHADERDLGDLLLRDELGRVRLLDVDVQLDQVLLGVFVDLLGQVLTQDLAVRLKRRKSVHA